MKEKWIWSLVFTGIFAVALFIGHLLADNGSAEASATLKVLNPRGEIEPPKTFAPAPRVTDLADKKIGIYWNGKQGGPNFWDVVEELLKKRFPTATILRRYGASDIGVPSAAKLVKEVDTFIYGVGD